MKIQKKSEMANHRTRPKKLNIYKGEKVYTRSNGMPWSTIKVYKRPASDFRQAEVNAPNEAKLNSNEMRLNLKTSSRWHSA